MRKLLIILLFFSLGCQEDFSGIIEFRSIAGEVLETRSMEPIEEATIITNPLTELEMTDMDGRFRLDSLTADFYTLRINADGFQESLLSLNLRDGSLSNVTILLDRDSIANEAPSLPFNPNPENNSIDQELELTLSWSASDDKDSLRYTVYFFRPEMIEAEIILRNSLDTSVMVNDLELNTTYFWQVEVTDKDGISILGPVWNFKTKVIPTNEFRYCFVREVNGYDQIFIAKDTLSEIQLTFNSRDHWRPTWSPQRDKIAFLSFDQGDVHIYTMDINGENVEQITSTRPLRTKDFQETPFSWAENGERIIYMDFNELLSIRRDGSGLFELGFEADGDIITSVDYTSLGNGKLVVCTESPNTKTNSKLFVYDVATQEQIQYFDTIPGQYSHAQWSPNGLRVLFTFNPKDAFSTSEIPLNKRVFIYDFESGELFDLSEDKPGGTSDNNPRFAIGGDFVIFNNGFSDETGTRNTFIIEYDFGEASLTRNLLFEDSDMTDWE